MSYLSTVPVLPSLIICLFICLCHLRLPSSFCLVRLPLRLVPLGAEQVRRVLTNSYVKYKNWNTTTLVHSAVTVLQFLEAMKTHLPNKLGTVDINELSLYSSGNCDGTGSPVEPYHKDDLIEEINGDNTSRSPFIVHRKSI